MTALLEQQYELGENGLVFGGVTTTPYYVAAAEWGAPETRDADTPSPREDGTGFGRDWLDGFTITFDINIISRLHATTARDAWSAMAAAWKNPALRTTPRAVVPLRYRLSGVDRRVYGRPRNIAHTPGNSKQGWIPVTAEFVTAEPWTYDDAEQSTTVPIVGSVTGGFPVPASAPWSSVAAGSPTERAVVVGGDTPTWLPFTVHGPVINPVVEVAGQWTATLRTTLLSGQWVTVDPRPWNRSVRDHAGGNRAGVFSAATPALSAMRVPPGVHQVGFSGQDLTGTAYVQPRWRNCHAGY